MEKELNVDYWILDIDYWMLKFNTQYSIFNIHLANVQTQVQGIKQ